MDPLADLDTSFLVPCKRCKALLQEQERVCPFCGEDQTRQEGASEDPALDSLAATDAAETEMGLVRPGAFWRKEAPGRPWRDRGTRTSRLMIGVVAVLALLVLALAAERIYLGPGDEAGRQREFGANIERAQGALARGDMAAARRALDALDAEHATDPSVQALRQIFDRRQREQTVRHEQLQDAVQKASKALGFAEPAQPATVPATPSPSPSPAPSPTPTPVPAPPAEPPQATAPTPVPAAADPKPAACSEAIAALGLCPPP